MGDDGHKFKLRRLDDLPQQTAAGAEIAVQVAGSRRDGTASEGHISLVVWRWRSHSKSSYGACPEFCEGEMRILRAIFIDDNDAARPSAISECVGG